MEKPCRMILYVCLWVCCCLLIQASASSAQVQGGDDDRSAKKYGGMYRRSLANNPTTLDPIFVTDIYSGTVTRQLFDGLVQFDAHLRPVPAIAQFWEASRDGRTWTFTLRQGVRFHNGREVTAQDFVYSFTRLLDPKRSPGPLIDFLRHIEGADAFLQGQTASVPGLKAVDRYIFELRLTEPYAPSLSILGLGNA